MRTFRTKMLWTKMMVICSCASAYALDERYIPPKPPSVSEPEFESDLQVKFIDELKVRAVDGSVISAVQADLSAILAVKQQYGLTFAPLTYLPQDQLDFLEADAAQKSGIAQPDLAGSLSVSGPAENMQAAAQALLALQETEWVEFVMRNPVPPQCADIPPPTGDYFVEPYFSEPCGVPLRLYHLPDPGLDMFCAWEYGGRGHPDVQITDCEFAFRRSPDPAAPIHEDLCDVLVDQPFSCLHNTRTDILFNSHGLAVLGMLRAQDNTYGWTGLVPDVSVSVRQRVRPLQRRMSGLQ